MSSYDFYPDLKEKTNPGISAAAQALENTVAAAVCVLGEVSAGHPQGLDGCQSLGYQVAFLASESAELRAVERAVSEKRMGTATGTLAASLLARSGLERIDRFAELEGISRRWLGSPQVREVITAAGSLSDPTLAEIEQPTDPGLGPELLLARREFRRFGQEVIAPHAEEVHRRNLDVPEEVISGLAALGVFGLSIPTRYGGSLDQDQPSHLAMVVATEELSRASLAIGGSLITRPEMLAQALTRGGTEAQKERWLPDIASGKKMVAICVTEPDYGSDVASVTTTARRDGDTWVINGTKMWSTFAGRAELLMVLVRTHPDPDRGHRGLSLFVVEKPPQTGHSFTLTQPGGGRLSGRAIPTIGYRGMHSFELLFENWVVPYSALIGEEEGMGRGFHLQMQAFSTGRLQTAGRALGLMEAAFEEARRYAAGRKVFGKSLDQYPLTRERLAQMAARMAAHRAFAYQVAHYLDEPRGQTEASMVKALACRSAEEITRDCMQIFGGYGYAEEYPVSRFFVDARVLSIFEGAEEVLALKVIARRLIRS